MNAVTAEFIKDDELVKLWDRHILVIWFQYPNCKLKKAIEIFFIKHPNVDKVQFFALPRVPGKFIQSSDLRFWVNRTMNPIWEKLIEIKEDDVIERAAILKKIHEWKGSCKSIGPRDKADKELRQLRIENRQNVVSSTRSRVEINRLYESHRALSQWNVCK